MNNTHQGGLPMNPAVPMPGQSMQPQQTLSPTPRLDQMLQGKSTPYTPSFNEVIGRLASLQDRLWNTVGMVTSIHTKLYGEPPMQAPGEFATPRQQGPLGVIDTGIGLADGCHGALSELQRLLEKIDSGI